MFTFAYLVNLSFFSFLSVFCLFYFNCFIPQREPCSSFAFQVCFSQFCSGIYTFCSPGQTIVLYFCQIAFIMLMSVYVQFVFSHTFYSCYKLLHQHLAFAVLWSFPFLFFFFLPGFSFLFFIILTFNVSNLLYFFYMHSFACLSYSPFLLPHVYKSSSSTSI